MLAHNNIIVTNIHKNISLSNNNKIMSYMKHLYVLFLENEKWILHPSTTSDPYYIFMECYFMYDFVKANCP